MLWQRGRGLVRQKPDPASAMPGGKAGSYAIPDSVTCVGPYAFSGCTSLTSVIIATASPSSGTGVQVMHRSDQRHDPRQRHRHRGGRVLVLRGPDEGHDPQRREQHRELCVLFLRRPDRRVLQRQCPGHGFGCIHGDTIRSSIICRHRRMGFHLGRPGGGAVGAAGERPRRWRGGADQLIWRQDRLNRRQRKHHDREALAGR